MKMHNPTNAGAGVRRQVAPRRLLGLADGTRRQHRQGHGCHPRGGAQHHRHRDRRQRRLAGCLSRRRHHAVPRRKRLGVRRRLARAGHHVVARTHSGRRAVRRDDVAHRLLGDAGHDGRPHAAAARRLDRTTTASRSTSTASTTAPTSSGKAQHSARRLVDLHRWRELQGVRADIGGDPKEPWLNIAWKYLYTAKDTWLGADGRTWARSARSTTSPWTRTRNTT